MIMELLEQQLKEESEQQQMRTNKHWKDRAVIFAICFGANFCMLLGEHSGTLINSFSVDLSEVDQVESKTQQSNNQFGLVVQATLALFVGLLIDQVNFKVVF